VLQKLLLNAMKFISFLVVEAINLDPIISEVILQFLDEILILFGTNVHVFPILSDPKYILDHDLTTLIFRSTDHIFQNHVDNEYEIH